MCGSVSQERERSSSTRTLFVGACARRSPVLAVVEETRLVDDRREFLLDVVVVLRGSVLCAHVPVARPCENELSARTIAAAFPKLCRGAERVPEQSRMVFDRKKRLGGRWGGARKVAEGASSPRRGGGNAGS